jgi:glycosyltransferase involved in cell wall biosynthesis
VCVIGLRGFPDVPGGVETHCEQVLTRLSRTSSRRFVVLGRSGYVRRARLINDRLKVKPVWALRNKYLEALPNALAGLFYAWAMVRPGVLHVHAIGPALITPLAKLMGLRVVVTHHGRDYDRAKWNWFGRVTLRMGEWAALRFADRVIAVSPSLARGLKRRFPRRAQRIRYVPNGAEAVTDAIPVTQVLERWGLSEGGFVLAAGRLVPEKRFDDLVTAFERSGVVGKLVIAGAADHGDEYARSLVARASERVIFTCALDRRSLEALYRSASLFVLPSSHEGLPIAPLEAIAAGAPVVLSDISANRDLGLPAKHYFRCGDVDAIARALAAPASFNVDREAVMARFDWDAVAAQTLEIYESVLDSSGMLAAIERGKAPA